MGKMQKYLAEVLGTFTLVVVGSFAIVSQRRPRDGVANRLDRARFRSRAPDGAVRVRRGVRRALQSGRVARDVPRPTVVDRGHDRLLDLAGVGAIAASIVVLIAYDDTIVAPTTTQARDTWAAIVVEIVLSALFIAVIFHSTVSERYDGTALLAIPLALVAIHVAAIPISGASVNPARSLGPALVGDRVHGPLDLPDRTADRRGARLDRVQGRRPGRHRTSATTSRLRAGDAGPARPASASAAG